MIENMATVHMTEGEVARDLHGVLARVQQGVEVVVEQNHRPVAVIRAPLPNGRLLSGASRWLKHAAQPLSPITAS
jgi:antitoxin (DNA-binding transcriptional repressor) of toxin-antitoxin stability system